MALTVVGTCGGQTYCMTATFRWTVSIPTPTPTLARLRCGTQERQTGDPAERKPLGAGRVTGNLIPTTVSQEQM